MNIIINNNNNSTLTTSSMNLSSYVKQLLCIDSERVQTCVRCCCRFNEEATTIDKTIPTGTACSTCNNTDDDTSIHTNTINTTSMCGCTTVNTTTTNNNNIITCSSCLLTRYCSKTCMEKDHESHSTTCESIASSIQSCDEIVRVMDIHAHDDGRVSTTMSMMSEWKDRIRHWHRLTSLLFVGTLNVSEMKNVIIMSSFINKFILTEFSIHYRHSLLLHHHKRPFVQVNIKLHIHHIPKQECPL